MKLKLKTVCAMCSAALAYTGAAHAVQIQVGDWNGALDSQITGGIGIRAGAQNCGLIGDPTTSCGSSANTGMWSGGDNGDLNYKAGQVFTGYAKFTPELLLHNPGAGLDLMARASFLYDPMAVKTQRTELSTDAAFQIEHNAKLLDLWIGKKFDIDGNSWRMRIGNQVVNWGESVFLAGGINATNALDVQKSLIPGTQIKEYVLPAPMLLVGGQLGKGWNVDAYYQFAWNANIYPPIGSYWSTADYFGRGTTDVLTYGPTAATYGLDAAATLRAAGVSGVISQNMINAQNNAFMNAGTAIGILGNDKPKNAGQYGIAFHDKIPGSVVDLGFYYLHYHDKAPVFNFVDGYANFQAAYRNDRDLFGISTNFPVGPWAIGGELSYRPRDAISLSGPTNGAALTGTTPLWMDSRRWETHLSAQLTLTPSDNPTPMGFLKADAATLTAEAVGTYYPGLQSTVTRQINGVTVQQMVQAGYIDWVDGNGNQRPVGTALSTGAIVDFNWTYDGTVINGWQVTPGVTYFRAVSGYTPNFSAMYLQGAQSLNFYLLFNQNPTVWQAGLNFTKYFGGDEPSVQPYRDRSFGGAFVTYNF